MTVFSAIIFSTSLLSTPLLSGAHGAAGPRYTSKYTIGPSVQPLIIVGEGWSQQFNIINVDYYDGDPTVGILYFYRKDGQPWKVPLKGYGLVDHVNINVRSGRMIVLETEVSYGQQELGWAYFDLSDRTKEWGIYRAYAVFRKQQSGQPDLMTSVPFVDGLEDEWVIPFDNEDGKYPGIALVNSGETTTKFLLEITDCDGNLLKVIQRSVGPLSLDWFSLVHENTDLAMKRGQIRITGGLFSSAVLTLQFTPNGAFTGIPIVHTYGMH